MNRKLSNRELAEIVGVLAVVASLVFVGLQLMLDRKIASGEQYSARAMARQSMLQSYLESDAAYPHTLENGKT